MTPKVIAVTPLENKCIRVSFANGETRRFDVKPYITGPWYGDLQDDAYFGKVAPAGRTVAWPDGQDIAPHELYELGTPC